MGGLAGPLLMTPGLGGGCDIAVEHSRDRLRVGVQELGHRLGHHERERDGAVCREADLADAVDVHPALRHHG